MTGIIIQRPVPQHLNIRELQTAIIHWKDVEGMHPPRSATLSIAT